MRQPISQVIEKSVEDSSSLTERLNHIESAYASIQEEKRGFYKSTYWLLVTLHEAGSLVAATAYATILVRKQLAYKARLQLKYFCRVLSIPDREPETAAKHIDKFIIWFGKHGIAIPEGNSRTLLGNITKAEHGYADLITKGTELKLLKQP